MDIRKLLKIQDSLSRVQCSRYSDLDDKIIAKASSLGIPLIGGTALEVLASYYGVSGVRKRSNNDLDFLTKDNKNKLYFMNWVRENVDSDKVQVDFYDEAKKNYRDYILDIDGILVMNPVYLIWSKLIRASKKDLTDIKWLLTIPQLTDEEISEGMDDLGLKKSEIALLESLL